MPQRMVGVEARLGGIGVRSANHQQILVKVLGRVLEAGRALDGRSAAAAQVDLAARQRRGTTMAAGALHDEYARPGAGGF